MLEIPESRTISLQAGKTLTGQRITEVFNATSSHKFAFFYGDPAGYAEILKGRQVKSAKGHGMFVDICCDEGTFITIGEGTNMRYYLPSEQPPEKYQLLIVFDDGSFVAFNVAMYGGIWAYKGIFDNPYHQHSLKSISPLEDAFDEVFFDNILQSASKDLSAKALLATEQRIPGIGNGVLQDILFNTGIHPKRKKSTLTNKEKGELFHSLKSTLKNMADQGGRDTEKDFFGNNGGYKTILSKNTGKHPCPKCGDLIVKEAYLGGAVYYCPTCQKL
ncbi:MAG: endonuclease VIII, partial [Bacteroidia bacterium]|jgi:formamidopyrimidine-DNA glycosylase|nr:endonuclease VIII [Bacteroidia bacterium]